MRVKIIHNLKSCIRCGRCLIFFPELFELKDGQIVLKGASYKDGIASIEVEISDENKLKVLENICPTGAIKIEK